MNTSTKIALAVVILMGFGSFQAKALEPGECTPWASVRGGLCKVRKCLVGESPVLRVEREEVCRPIRPIRTPVPPVSRAQTIPGGSIPGGSEGSIVPK